MEISFSKEHRYRCITDTKIETGCSTICQAQDLDLNRDVCIKMVKISGQNKKEVNLRLEKAMLEIKAMVRISEHTDRVPIIYETFFDETNLTLYIVMQWISGCSLKDKMGVSEIQFIRWMIDLCDVLSLMERRHLYHKDIKPANIMINSKNELYLIDFNISVSTPNRIEGTVHYKAPEMDYDSKYMGREKVDMFAVGVMMYEYYAKEVPKRTKEYAKNSERGSFEWDLFVEPIQKNPNIPTEINEIIIKCMKLDPKQRYRNNNELKNALKNAERSLRNEKSRRHGSPT